MFANSNIRNHVQYGGMAEAGVILFLPDRELVLLEFRNAKPMYKVQVASSVLPPFTYRRMPQTTFCWVVNGSIWFAY
ncbi:Pogo transposable element with KRAB domain protein [Fusarium oxysporum f. sp. albedinis]|nr:Pogo transposable element with KRAB domain protein [Fusarium oxysporum f. sp. albedinis]